MHGFRHRVLFERDRRVAELGNGLVEAGQHALPVGSDERLITDEEPGVGVSLLKALGHQVYRPRIADAETSCAGLLEQVKGFYQRHPAAAGRRYRQQLVAVILAFDGIRDLAVIKLEVFQCHRPAAGADGIMVEVHPRPEEALSDGPQSLRFEEFRRLMEELRPVVEAVGRKV